jgi:nickel-dependent lactate racemase
MLDEEKARLLLEEGLARVPLEGRKTLVITPDSTRSGPMPMIFRLLAELLLPRVLKLDFLIALGTHQPLSQEAINYHNRLSQE